MDNWTVYVDTAALLADIASESDAELAFPSGSGWQRRASREDAERILTECLAAGYRRGHNTAPNY